MYYSSNLFLQKLHSLYPQTFRVPTKGTWHLIYSDCDYGAKWQFHVLDLDLAGFLDIHQLPRLPSLPGLDLWFSNDGFFSVREWDSDKILRLNSESLFEFFFELGLVLESGVKSKEFNVASSSRYHEWQSQQLFTGGITDIDLFRLNDSGHIVEIVEVKRSRVPLSRWSPYPADRGGYEILHKLSKKLSFRFSVVYYQFDPPRQYENIDLLKIFRKENGFKFVELGYFSFAQFVSGDYLE